MKIQYYFSAFPKDVNIEYLDMIPADLRSNPDLEVIVLKGQDFRTAQDIIDFLRQSNTTGMHFHLLLEPRGEGMGLKPEDLQQISACLKAKHKGNMLLVTVVALEIYLKELNYTDLFVNTSKRLKHADEMVFLQKADQNRLRFVYTALNDMDRLHVVERAKLLGSPLLDGGDQAAMLRATELVAARARALSVAEYPDVVSSFWYDEDFIQKLILAQAKDLGLLLLQSKYAGIVYKTEDSIYEINSSTYSICADLVLGSSESAVAAKLENFDLALQAILKVQHAQHLDHTMLFALNLESRHWCLGTVTFRISNNKVLGPVEISVYDSLEMFDEYRLQLLRGMLDSKLKQHSETTLEYATYMLCPRRQPDGFSCGPLTVHNMWQLIRTGFIDKHKSAYSAADILKIRADHLRVLNDPELTKRQKENRAASQLMAKPAVSLNLEAALDNLRKICDSLSKEEVEAFEGICLSFLISDLQDELSNSYGQSRALLGLQLSFLRNFVSEAKIENLSIATESMSLEEKHKILGKNKIALKDWFVQHESLVREHQLYTMFFEEEKDKNDGSLRWLETGVQTFVNLMLAAYSAPLQTPKSTQAKPIVAQAVPALSLEPEPDYVDVPASFANELQLIQNHIAELGVGTYFYGSLGEKGKFLDGLVFAKVGPKLDIPNFEVYVFYKGSLLHGEPHGIGTLSIHTPVKDLVQFYIYAEFKHGKILQVFKQQMPGVSIGECVQAHFNKYSTELGLQYRKVVPFEPESYADPDAIYLNGQRYLL